MSKSGSETRNANTRPERREILSTLDDRDQTSLQSHRRGFIHRLSVVVGAVFTTITGLSDRGFATKSTRRDTAKAAAREYDSREEVREAAEKYADEIIVALSNRGYLDSDTTEALPTENFFTDLKRYSEASRGVFVFGTVSDGQPRTIIQFKEKLSDDRELRTVISPQASHSYAVLIERLATGRALTSFTTTESEDGTVTTQSCTCMDYNSDCYIYCNSVGSCSCAEITNGDHCTDDSGADCTYCTIDYSECNSCSETYSCP